MFNIRNLLKVAMVCLCVGCFGITQASALKNNEIKAWYDQKRQTLNIQHPTPEEKAAIDAAKKEWDEKSKTLTKEEYEAAFDEWWDSLPKSQWLSLNPETSTDADVRAAASEDYIWQAIYDYADSKEGQAKAPEKPATETPAEEQPVSDFVAPLQPQAEQPAQTPQWGNTENQWNPQFGATDNSGADAEIVVPYAPGAAPSVTTKVTTNENGKVTTEETSGTLGPKGDTTTGGGSDNETGDVKPTNTENKPDDTKKEDEEKPKDETTYSGVYKGHQIIPNLMALHCKVNAEDIVKDLSLMEKCIRQYLTEMNNENAAAKEEAMKDYNNLRYAVINDNLAVAITKAASIAGYEEKMNEYAEATSNADTKFDTETAVAYTQAFSTDVMNSIRELYVEMIKYEAVNGLIDVDPSAIVEGEETEKQKYMADLETKANDTTINAETKIGDMNALIADRDALMAKLAEYEKMSPEEFALHRDEVLNLKANLMRSMTAADATDAQIATAQMGIEKIDEILEENAAQKAASGGEDDFVEVDENGNAINKNMLQEVTVTGSSKLDKYEKMTPEEFAKHKDEVEALKAELIAAMQEGNASDSEIAGAQRALERLSKIEAQKAGQGSDDKSADQQTTPPADSNDPVVRDLMGRSNDDLNDLYKDTQRDQEELSDTIFKMKQIKEKWQKQNKWTEEDEKQLQEKMTEYKETQDYLKQVEAEMKRRGK